MGLLKPQIHKIKHFATRFLPHSVYNNTLKSRNVFKGQICPGFLFWRDSQDRTVAIS